jgi:hypothetical protein
MNEPSPSAIATTTIGPNTASDRSGGKRPFIGQGWYGTLPVKR